MHADIWRQSQQEGILEEAGQLLEFWRCQRPHLVEQHGGAHITVNLGQRHEQLGPLVVTEVVQLDEPLLQDGVRVVSQWNEELWDALDGALLQGLDNVVVLGQGRRDAPGDKLGLGLGKTAANLGQPELGELDSEGVDGVDLVGDDGVDLVGDKGWRAGAAALFPRTIGEGRPALILLSVSMAKTWLRAKQSRVTTVKVSNQCLVNVTCSETRARLCC